MATKTQHELSNEQNEHNVQQADARARPSAQPISSSKSQSLETPISTFSSELANETLTNPLRTPTINARSLSSPTSRLSSVSKASPGATATCFSSRSRDANSRELAPLAVTSTGR